MEGNIASGKSSMLEKAVQRIQEGTEEKKFDVRLVPECYERFNKFRTFKPLELCSQNARENCVATQLHIIRCINSQMREMNAVVRNTDAYKGSNKEMIFLCDRSMFSPGIFIDAMYKLNFMNNFTREILQCDMAALANETNIHCNLKIIGMAYLDIPVEECLKRLYSRGRGFEQRITREYMDALDESQKRYVHFWSQKFGPHMVYRMPENNPDELINIIELALNRALNTTAALVAASNEFVQPQ